MFVHMHVAFMFDSHRICYISDHLVLAIQMMSIGTSVKTVLNHMQSYTLQGETLRKVIVNAVSWKQSLTVKSRK